MSQEKRKTRSRKVNSSRGGRKDVARGAKPQTAKRVTEAISKMRAGASLRKASRESKVAPRTVLKRAASALRRTKSGRYAAKANDRLVRSLMIPTPQGLQEISIRGLRAASRLARYWVAVHKYYATGDTSGLRQFEGEFVTGVDGVNYPLLTDTDVLNRLGSAGVLTFESLYGRST